MPGCPALSQIRKSAGDQSCSLTACWKVKRVPGRQQSPARAEFPAQQEHRLSLLPGVAFRKSSSSAADPVMSSMHPSENTRVGTHERTNTQVQPRAAESCTEFQKTCRQQEVLQEPGESCWSCSGKSLLHRDTFPKFMSLYSK